MSLYRIERKRKSFYRASPHDPGHYENNINRKGLSVNEIDTCNLQSGPEK